MKEDEMLIGETQGFPRPLEEFEEKIGVKFENRALLRASLTHSSYWGDYAIAESERLERSYERLEFLGDSVVALSVCTYLFEKYVDQDQGYLSKLKGQIVSNKSMVKAADRLEIGNYIRVGRGINGEPWADRSPFMVDCTESFVGAVYLEFGFERARQVVYYAMEEMFQEVDNVGVFDYKTTLQEMVQKKFRCLPRYRLIGQSGPEHSKVFKIHVYVGDELCGEGEGRSKKDAEVIAAQKALHHIEWD